MIDAIVHCALGFAATPWVFVVLFAFTLIDGIFPPIPSESVVIAVASLAAARADTGAIVPLVGAALAGALSGDLLAYALGRWADFGRWRPLRTRRGAAAFAWAASQLHRRGGPLILAARYVPVGRVAVNMTAGSARFPFRRFAAFASLAGLLWAATSCAIGWSAGQFAQDQPLLGMAIGIAVGLAIGVAIERLLAWCERRRTNQEDPSSDEADGGLVPVGTREGGV